MSVLARLLRRSGDPGLVLEPMRRRDLGAVLCIERTSYPRPWTENIFRNELEMASRGERCYVVARRDGALAGYAGMMFVVDEAHVTNVAVAAEERRGGVGSRLLAELLHEARRRGCTGVTLEVRASNSAAQALYALAGFTEAGIRRNYYENTEDAIVMWLHDLQSDECAARLAALSPEATR